MSLGLTAVIAGTGVATWYYHEAELRERAGMRLADAGSVEALQAVAQDFAGTEAALLAILKAADLHFEQGRMDQAAALYEEAVKKYPESSLVPSALLGLATILETRGKVDEAVKVYQSVAATYPQSFQAPQASFSAARALDLAGRLQEARKAYEDLIANHPDSGWRHEAEATLVSLNRRLKQAPAKSG